MVWRAAFAHAYLMYKIRFQAGANSGLQACLFCRIYLYIAHLDLEL